MAIIRHNLHFWSQKYEEFTQLIVSFIALLTVLFSQNSLKAVDLIFFPLGTNDIITAAVLVPNVRAIVSSKQVFTNGITGLTGTAVDLYNNFYKADNLGNALSKFNSSGVLQFAHMLSNLVV